MMRSIAERVIHPGENECYTTEVGPLLMIRRIGATMFARVDRARPRDPRRCVDGSVADGGGIRSGGPQRPVAGRPVTLLAAVS